MNRNNRFPKTNQSKRGKASMNGPHVTNSRGHISSPTLFHKPLHNSDHGHQQLDENNPFSHLALEISMDRPSANPFDKGIMPSFDDRAIEEDYRNENAKRFDGEFGRMRGDRKPPIAKRPPTKEVVQPTKEFAQPTKEVVQPTKKFVQPTKEFVPPPLLLNDVIPTERYVKDVKTAVAPVVPVREPIHVKTAPAVHEELDLDDFLPRTPAIIPSIDLKPQINFRSRNATAPHVDIKSRGIVPIRKPVDEPVIAPPKAYVAQTKSVIAPPVAPVSQTKHNQPYVAQVQPKSYIPPPVLHAPQTKPNIPQPVAHAGQTKPIIDYFGTHSSKESKQEVDQKEECFRESQLEANKILFGVEEPSRPLTNVEVSKRKKLILKLVDQKLKAKLNELMNKLVERTESTGNAFDIQEHNDTFDDQMQNLVPDSLPDNVQIAENHNWVPYPSEPSEQTWNNFQPDTSNKDYQETWPTHPMYQQNTGWVEPPHMNPFPPGVDPIHVRFPRMPHMRPQWNPNQWNPHMRPPEPHWQPQQNWNHPRQMNPHLIQPNVNLYPPDEQHPKPNLKPAAEIELELKEKEFLERTLMGSKNTQRRDADRLRRRSRERTRRSRSRSRGDRKRSSQDRVRERSKHESRTSSNRSTERIVHRVLSPSRLSPHIASPLRSFRSHSIDHFQEMLCEDIRDQFEHPISELMPTRSRSRESEDLRVRLSERRNKAMRSRSPTDLRNKLSDLHRSDDLRNQLSDRSRRKPSRSQSSSRSSKRTRPDVEELEWIKFNNIVGMLMNIDRDAELSSEELTEKKEIMRLLLENPDLLELDEKFVYRFGKSRLNLAVKEAENILYPKGVPDERVASLISKKIAGLSTETKSNVTKHDTVPIEWIKLCSIVDQMLRLTVDERRKLSATDKRMLERDELLLKASEDPNLLLTLGTKYGHRNVEWATKFAKKILYRNGSRDRRVDASIAKEREKVLNRIGKANQSRNSSERHRSKNSSESDSRSNLKEWNQLSEYVTRLVQSTLEKYEKMSREDLQRRDDLLVQMSRDPDAIRSDTHFTDNIDKAILNDVIEKCKKVIASVKSNDDKFVVREFERIRTRLINSLKVKTVHTTIYDQILTRISRIFGKGHEKWTDDEINERKMLTDELIKNPDSLKTNAAAVQRIGDALAVDEIIADVKKIISQLEPSRSKGPKKFYISSSKVLDIPFVVKIEDASGQLNDETKTVLLKALRDMITEIENPPKPKLLQQRYIDKRVEVVCYNLLTFEWLKRAIVSDFKDKWSGADLKIERVPVDPKIPRDKLKSVMVSFKDARATLPFDDIVKEIKKENSKLHPERWELYDSRGGSGDYKKKTVGIDIESLAALEQMNRFARLGRSLVYFDISYMGDNVPNFEATCQ